MSVTSLNAQLQMLQLISLRHGTIKSQTPIVSQRIEVHEVSLTGLTYLINVNFIFSRHWLGNNFDLLFHNVVKLKSFFNTKNLYFIM